MEDILIQEMLRVVAGYAEGPSCISDHSVKIRPAPERRLGDGLPRPHGRVPCHLAVNKCTGFSRAFIPAGGATSWFLLVLREAEKVSKKDVLPRPRSNWGALPVGLYSDMTCPRALAPFMTTGRRPVSQLESREEIGP